MFKAEAGGSDVLVGMAAPAMDGSGCAPIIPPELRQLFDRRHRERRTGREPPILEQKLRVGVKPQRVPEDLGRRIAVLCPAFCHAGACTRLVISQW